MRYFFESINEQGKTITGEYEADSEIKVIEYLQKRRLKPLLVKPKKAAPVFTHHLSFFEKITTVDRITLVRNLAATNRAGLSILDSLEILAQDASKPLLKKILLQIKSNVEGGQPLWQSFQNYQQHFPPFFVGMVRAAETSGKLDVTLQELTQYLTREYNLLKKIKSALTYPLILLMASFGVVVFLLGFVLPRVEKTFERSQIVLPLATRILLQISHAIKYSILLDVFILAGIVAVVFFLYRSTAGKKFFTKILFRIPLVREVMKKVALVRFSRTLGSLLSSGTPITEALELSANSVGNEFYKQAIIKANKDIARGLALSKSLATESKLFPHFLVSLVTVGERTGTLTHVLKTFADFYDEEVDYTLKSVATFLEPIMLLLMGVIIGLIALSILLPIYQIVGKYV
ncbi:MAG: type II secretion system F family protein [Patescibacteria group bacterium]